VARAAGCAGAALAVWLTVRAVEPGSLLWELGNRNHDSRLSDCAVYHIMTGCGKEADGNDFSPDFRRTFESSSNSWAICRR
jgi:hypothetical protein